MQNIIKITGVVVLALVLAVVFLGVLLVNIENVFGISRTVTPGVQDQEYLLNATSSATSRSSSYSIAGMEKVTLFIGTIIEEGVFPQQTVTYTFEVSDVPEPGQGTALVGTSTPVTRTVDDVEIPQLVVGTSSPFALAAKTFGTTTVSIDLRQHTYPFLRVIRTATAANRSTSTVSIIKQP